MVVPSAPPAARRGRPAVEPRALPARAKRSPTNGSTARWPGCFARQACAYRGLLAIGASHLPWLAAIDEQVWDDINFYYQDIRCDFYHQSASKTIVDVSLLDYRDTVKFMIDEAFGINISSLVEAELAKNTPLKVDVLPVVENARKIRVTDVDTIADKLLIAVAAVSPQDTSQVNDYFKKEGESRRLKQPEFRQVVAQNSGSKKYFYYDNQQKVWLLSALGKFKLTQLAKGDSNVE